MSINTWVEYLLQAFVKHKNGQPGELRHFATLLHEQDEAKTALVRKGYGGAGMPLRAAVEEVPERRIWNP